MIEVSNMHVRAGNFELKEINFKVNTGEYAVLMGPTGSGKTTLLEAICGLKNVLEGTISINHQDVRPLKPGERGIGFVPQDVALFPTMTVEAHLAFALQIRKWPRDQVESRVKELLNWLGITHLIGRRPEGLSGGEKQRVALGRALSFKPDVLCLDEPLSALDAATREEMYQLLLKIRQDSGATILHITHSLEEKEELADRLFEIQKGQLQERPLAK